ncbi:MAG: hypothetical protein KKE12_07505, partial [Proteobacteria bacterium]|nr:hypothetical protein [Pseudomonadota bacterium]
MNYTNIAMTNITETFTKNVTFSDEIILSANKNIYLGSNRAYSNTTCYIIKGSSATFEVC